LRFSEAVVCSEMRCPSVEWHDDSVNWFRTYGNENWELDQSGLTQWRVRLHQRCADQCGGAEIPLDAGAPS
jgi:nuclear transport factor 2 (NTF2) superfamily protein